MLRVGPQSANMLPAIAVIGATGRWWLIVPAILLFLAVGLIVAWLIWYRFTWRVDEDGIAIDSGIISRNSRDIPFDRIQDVAIEQGLLARLVGIATVSFDTGSAEADGKEEGKLSGIAMADAQALRTHIRNYRGELATGTAPLVDPTDGSGTSHGAVVAGAQAVTSGDTLLFAMSPKRLALAGLFNFSLAVFAVLFGLLNSFDQLLPFDPFDMDVWVDMAGSFGLEQWVAGHRWLAVLGGTISLLILGAVTGVVRTVVKEWNFRLERTARGLRRTRGLTTRTDVTLPKARLQAAIIDSGIIRRQFGWFALKLQSLASDGKDEADHVIAPFARIEEVDRLLVEIGLDRAGFGDGSSPDLWHRTHPVGFLLVPATMLGTALLIALVMSAVRPDLLWYCAIGGLLALLAIIPAWLAWRYRRWHFDGRLLHMTQGFFRRQHVILPARNIQSIDLFVGPLTRRLGLAGLRFGVAGGGGEHAIADMPNDLACALRDRLLAVEESR
jgi:putative membrane protein